MADELHYVPMPANVVKDIQNMWATGDQGREAASRSSSVSN